MYLLANVLCVPFPLIPFSSSSPSFSTSVSVFLMHARSTETPKQGSACLPTLHNHNQTPGANSPIYASLSLNSSQLRSGAWALSSNLLSSAWIDRLKRINPSSNSAATPRPVDTNYAPSRIAPFSGPCWSSDLAFTRLSGRFRRFRSSRVVSPVRLASGLLIRGTSSE